MGSSLGKINFHRLREGTSYSPIGGKKANGGELKRQPAGEATDVNASQEDRQVLHRKKS